MTDNQIIRLFLPLLNAGMTAYGYSVIIKQSFQPTEQGADSEPQLFFTKVSDKRLGHPQRKSVWDTLLGKQIDTDTQLMEATYQITALVRQTSSSEKTASDYAHTAAMLMNGAEFISTLKASGVGILRITDVRNPYMKDDRDQFQASPSFDFTLSFNRDIIRDGKAVSLIEIKTERV